MNKTGTCSLDPIGTFFKESRSSRVRRSASGSSMHEVKCHCSQRFQTLWSRFNALLFCLRYLLPAKMNGRPCLQRRRYTCRRNFLRSEAVGTIQSSVQGHFLKKHFCQKFLSKFQKCVSTTASLGPNACARANIDLFVPSLGPPSLFPARLSHLPSLIRHSPCEFPNLLRLPIPPIPFPGTTAHLEISPQKWGRPLRLTLKWPLGRAKDEGGTLVSTWADSGNGGLGAGFRRCFWVEGRGATGSS